MTIRDVEIPVELAGQRLDRVVVALFPELSRSAVARLIDSGDVEVDGQFAKASFKVRAGAAIRLREPPPVPSTALPEPLPLVIRYEDADVLVVDKPAGQVVHPSPGHAGGTLVNALLAYDPTIAVGGALRPGIVHRLDKDTSGLLIVARNDRALRELQRQMQTNEVTKEYLALVHGSPPTDAGVIDAPIGRDPHQRQQMGVVEGGRTARSHFRVVERLGSQTLLRVRLETGRTHQIRVHLAAIGCPIVGDQTYGVRPSKLGLRRQFLHAARLTFRRPSDGREETVTSGLPDDLAEVLSTLRSPEGSALL